MNSDQSTLCRLLVAGALFLRAAVGFAAADDASSHATAEHSDDDSGKQGHSMAMSGMYGQYSMKREASGTSWQPDATPMDGLHLMKGEWLFMFHGFADLVYDRQGGRRGDDTFYSPNMFMAMGQRPAGPGTFGVRAMLSLEPATIRTTGYPLLLQTGETADGARALIDHQHPHDLFMELAAAYSYNLSADSSAFLYFGLPGEPALGPPAFMHRFSGVDNPEAPITHHWLDSTHITYGVATIGYIWKQWKVEGSIFTGREPDEDRWDIEGPKFDSYSARVSWNPTASWALQASYGNIHSPEQLHPDIDTERLTVSAMYHRRWDENHWQTILAWGQNRNHPGRNLDAWLIESALRLGEHHTIFARGENVEKDELFPEGDPEEGRKFTVTKASLGYIYDFAKWHSIRTGIGGSGSIHLLPQSLEPAYGQTPLSFMLFVRARL